nr:serine hydrolase [uncultured Flavobacterium sp.]
MRIIYKSFFFLLVFSFVGCSSVRNNPLEQILNTKTGIIHQVMQNSEEFEVQIIYSQIKRSKNGVVTFKDYKYHMDANQYFYPASTVKFPIAVMALEKLDAIPNTSINSTFSIGDEVNQWKFSEEISKLFAVSDNQASNHLFEFIGFDDLNNGMKSKGLSPFRITHRLSTANSGSRVVQPITLYKDDGTVVKFPSTQTKAFVPLKLRRIQKGKGYLEGEQIIPTPFDFSAKNYYPLEILHNTLKRVVFPEAFQEKERFKLSEKSREFILFSMQNLPKNAGYDPKEYFDGYCKFFMFGDSKETIPDHIKIYNKVGEAYGTLTDCAYIIDSKNNIEFLVSATILVNKNKIFNDGIYEYDSIGFPFLAELGRQLYQKSKQ